MINKKIFLYFFPIISLVFILANYSDNLLLSYISKPLMVTSLAIFFYLSTKGKFSSFGIYVLLALLSSAMGDGLLAVAQGNVLSPFFMIGLIGFFLSHIFYTFAFLNTPGKMGKGFLQKKPIWLIPFLVIMIVFMGFLWPNIPGNLRIPFAIYGQAVLYMALTAINMKNQIPTKIHSTLLLGSALFIISDLLIAFIRFEVDQIYVPQPRLLIILTYLAGQYFLMRGSLTLIHSNINQQ